MTYSPTIPKPTQSPKFSAARIQTNFSQFASIFSNTVLNVTYNHVALDNFNQGKHAAIIMQRQPISPDITQNLAVLVAINATTAAGTQPQLFSKIPKFLPTNLDTKNALNAPVRLTYNQVNVTGPQYQSFLPGGYLVYFGSTTTVGSPITVTPTPTKIIIALASSTGATAGNPWDVSTEVTQPDKFQINSTNAPGGSTFLYFVIAED